MTKETGGDNIQSWGIKKSGTFKSRKTITKKKKTMPSVYWGKQTFDSEKGEVTKFYRFDKKIEYEYWKLSDIEQFRKNKVKHLERKTPTEKEVKDFFASKGELSEKMTLSSIKLNKSYLHIKDPRYKTDRRFGIVVAFEDKKEMQAFIKENEERFPKLMTPIKKANDKRIICANANGLAMMHRRSKDNEVFVKAIGLAFKHYQQLDPTTNHFAFVSKSDFSHPQIIHFSCKRKRDLFTQAGRNSKYNTIVRNIGNFNPIVIQQVGLEITQKGNLKEHLQFLKKYNQKMGRKKSDKQRQSVFERRAHPRRRKTDKRPLMSLD